MKKSKHFLYKRNGFTLVELLVVITIIAVLAALSLTVTQKMRKRADAAKQTSILHQIGPLMMLHSTENNGLLPATQGQKVGADGKKVTTHWHQALHALINPELTLDQIKGTTYWNNKPLIRNPLFTKKTSSGAEPLQPWTPGYGMNTAIVDNLGMQPDYSNGQWQGNMEIRLAAIGDVARTPLIAPAPDYHYGTIKDKNPDLEQFLINKQLPILFVDGHVETIYPKEYEKRQLQLMPKR